IARAILSFGMLSARAARIAARRRGFMLGSGRPILAATVISRASLPNTFDLMASCRPLRCMMFLNWEWPAKESSTRSSLRNFSARFIGSRRDKIHRYKPHLEGAPKDVSQGESVPECGPRFLEPAAKSHWRDPRREA